MALTLLVGVSRLEIAGWSIGGTVGDLLIASAEAHKSPSRTPRGFGRGGKAATFLPPVFSPLPHGQAFAPWPPTKALPSPPKLPAFQPPPSPPVTPPVTGRPVPVKVPAPGQDMSTAKPKADKIAGLPTQKPPSSSLGGWDALVKPMPGPPKAMPSLSPDAGAGLPRKSFRRFLEKLEQHGPKQAPATKPSGKPKKKSQASPLVPRRLGGRPVGELLPPIGTFKAQEVLAINITAEGLAKARAGDFQVVGQTTLPGLGITLTHLLPPAALNAVSGRERLFDLVPDGGFVLNRVYASYRLGSGRQGSGSGAAPVQQDGGCPSERCFGSALIKWQPQLSACTHNLKIGIVDTGFDKTHPALTGLRYDYKEFLPDGSAKASPQHGTGILALLAGKSDSGTPGLIPDATFAIANAFFDDADGQPMSDTAQMVRALDWVKRSGVAVVNLSFAGPEDDLVHHAVRELTKAGVVVVAAAGNDGPGAPPSYPAAYEEVIAVTAVDRKLSAYRYAGRGDHIDLAAPGVDVWTAIPGRREGPQTGTSFAVPYVTAVVAVALSGTALAADGDALSPKRRALAMLQGKVVNLGGHGRDTTFGEGLVQAPDTCQVSPSIMAKGAPPTEPWTGTVVRTFDNSVPKTLAMGSWTATVRPVSGAGSAR